MEKEKKLQTLQFMSTNFAQTAYDLYAVISKDPNGRYLSWEHCYYAFYKARTRKNSDSDLKDLCLHLSFYLASWGMYRGSSFLLQKDYLVHIKAVREILRTEYDPLLGIECCNYTIQNLDLLFKLKNRLSSIYSEIKSAVAKEKHDMQEKSDDNESDEISSISSPISDTLITKILLGTLACVPAYDRFFVQGIRENGIANGQFNENSIQRLIKHYSQYFNDYEMVRKKMLLRKTITGGEVILYPQMKLMDMAFWYYSYQQGQRSNP